LKTERIKLKMSSAAGPILLKKSLPQELKTSLLNPDTTADELALQGWAAPLLALAEANDVALNRNRNYKNFIFFKLDFFHF
jgi:hypothetical protein